MKQLVVAALLVWLFSAGPGSADSALQERDRRAVIAAAADLIEKRYVDPAKGRSLARVLRRRGASLNQTDPETFAEAMTALLRELSRDGHFAVAYRRGGDREPSASAEAAQAEADAERYYGAVQRLDGGVGYLDLRVFAPVATAADLAQAAMSLLAQSPALIIDLRRNGGGHGEMAALLSAYVLDESVELSGVYDRPSGTLTRSFSPAVVPGRRFGGRKPLYILISNKTFSAAEAFAYDLQAMQRAVVVGETSGGGAHPFAYRAINERFILSLPEARSINPITDGNWQGRGVQPDVATAPDQALQVAIQLALRALPQPQGATADKFQ
jgi:C-terminal processing protease CtpA/Prc